MNCKNCDKVLRTDFSFCPNCGAKVIRNRITLKKLINDITENYFDLDNTFLKTFLHLFSKPQVVIDGYITGVRKKYMNPISYLGIALTLTGLILFLLHKTNIDIDYDLFNTGMNSDAMIPIPEYNSFLFLAYIPMMAVASWLVFKVKDYLFTERIVVFMYSMSQFNIAIFLPSLLILLFAPQKFMKFSYVSLPFIFIYNIWVIKKITGLKGMVFFAHILLFITFFIMQFILFYSVIMPFIMYVSEVLNIQDLEVI